MSNNLIIELEDQYIKYILSVIEQYQNSYNVIYNNEISPYLINEVLANYNNIFDKLNLEYQRQKNKLWQLQKEYDDWYDDMFVNMRKSLAQGVDPKKIKISVTEIDKELKIEHKDIYRPYRDKLHEMDMKVNYMRRVLENWKKVDGILNTLSNNLRSEMKGMSLIDRINKNVKGSIDNVDKKTR